MSANQNEAPAVVVGFDGSACARGALLFASAEAALRRRPLRVVYVREGPYWPGPGAAAVLTAAAEILHRAGSGVRAVYADDDGGAGDRLVAHSRGAELVVVGRGEGSVLGPLLGSVASDVVRRAACPAVVVSDDGSSYHPGEGDVVVGVDPAGDREGPLAAAFAEAHARNAGLVAVHAWSGAVPAGLGIDTFAKVVPDEALATAGRRLHEAVHAVHARYPVVPVTEVVQAGRPGKVLLAAAEGARLVVVGSRRNRTAAGALLGSVGQYLVRHAQCPVMVARPARAPTHALLVVGGP